MHTVKWAEHQFFSQVFKTFNEAVKNVPSVIQLSNVLSIIFQNPPENIFFYKFMRFLRILFALKTCFSSTELIICFALRILLT